MSKAVSFSSEDAADQVLKAQIEMQVDEERKAKKEKEAEQEAAKFQREMLKVEQDERREALQKGTRMHPDIRKLDALVLQMQHEEQEEHTNYLDWRDDVMEAVRTNDGMRASQNISASGPGLVLDLLFYHAR